MKNRFLVRAVHIEGTSFLQNKIYLASDYTNDCWSITSRDGTEISSGGWYKSRFTVLEFVDIWEFKRNGKLLDT